MSVRTLPKRTAWADEEDDISAEEKERRAAMTTDSSSRATASDKRDGLRRPQPRHGCEVAP